MSNLKNALNTAVSTHIMSKGLRTDQTIPSTLRRYLSLKSFPMSEERMNQLRFSVVLEAELICGNLRNSQLAV